jgi:membrane fusion protein (multidrug efflux system)
MSQSVHETESETDADPDSAHGFHDDGETNKRAGESQPPEKEGDQQENADNKADRKEKDSKGDGSDKGFHLSKKTIVIGSIIIFVILVTAFCFWLHASHFITTDDAYTTGHVHQISSRISATVDRVLVDDNQFVHANDVLVKLDPRDYQVALRKAQAAALQARAQITQAEARVSQTQAQGAAAQAQVLQAQSQVSAAVAQLERARSDYDRIAGLYSRDIKAVSKADVDAATEAFNRARSSTEGARANLSAAQAQAQAAEANVQAAVADQEVAKANAESSQSDVQQAELQLSYCNVIAPVAGKVSKKTVEEGQRVQPGQALLAVVPEDVWVLANLKETQLDRLRVGQRVDIEIDALAHKTFYGTVDSIQEGSGATYSLLPPDNATGNFTKIVQRVPVKIVFDPDSIRDFRDKIIPGLSVEPSIDLQSLSGDHREPKREKTEEKQNEAAESKNP